MEFNDISRIAQYQDTHWKEQIGVVQDFDYDSSELTLSIQNDKEFTSTLNPNGKGQLLTLLGLKGTTKDFETDKPFLKKAIARKIDSRSKPCKLIYDKGSRLEDDVGDWSPSGKAITGVGYKVVPNIKILDYGEKMFGSTIDTRTSYISDIKMIVNHTSKINKRLIAGDIIGFGNGYSNSQSRNGGLNGFMSMLRVICSNGWIDSKHISNIGIKHNSLHPFEMFQVGMTKMCTESKIKDMLKILDKATCRPSIVESIDEIPTMLKLARIPKRHHDGIVGGYLKEQIGMDEDGGINGWGIFNGVTNYTSHEYRQHPLFDAIEQQDIIKLAMPLLTVR